MSKKKGEALISFADVMPKLVEQWHPTKNQNLTPYNVSYGSAKMIWWICDQGHEWQDSPNHRSRGRGCRECAKAQRFITKRRNIVSRRGSLATNNPDLALQWHPTLNATLTPYDISANSSERVYWMCNKGHEWDAPVNSRNSGSGCPFCSGHKIIAGINDLATIRPDIAEQWHPTKNKSLTPRDVTLHNGNDVWWICEKGHAWRAKIANRANGCGCPVCSGKKVLAGFNDLATEHPEIAAQWHPIKNKKLAPTNITSKSNKVIWWMCEKGHEWKASVCHRSNGTRCPFCFGESRTSFPEQAILYYLSRFATAISRYKVNAKTEIDVYLPEYKIGVEYDGEYFHRGEKAKCREQRKQAKLDELGIVLFRVKEYKEECPQETRKNVVYLRAGPTDAMLTDAIYQLLEQIQKLVPITQNVVVDIAKDRSTIFEQYVASEKANSLLAVNPSVAAQWHPTKNGTLRPEFVSAGSNKKVSWICEKGHEWAAVINSRNKGVGCPCCAGKKAWPGYNDLATLDPELASEWHPTQNGLMTPADVTLGSNKKIWWRCKNGHEFIRTVYARKRVRVCPYCRQESVGK